MREWHAIPCANATFDEVRRGVHMHRNDNPGRLCNRCLKSGAGSALPAPSSPVPLLDAGEPGPRVSVSTAVPAGSLPDEYVAGRSTPVAPLRSRLAWSAPTVLDARTEGRGGSTFDDGFLSDPSPGEQQLQGNPSAGTGPFEGRAAAHQST